MELKLGVVESMFADIIWENEPITSGHLTKLCEEQLHWKRTTTYTVLRKLCDRGIFQNQKGVVSSILTKQEFYAIQGDGIIEKGFEGSLPAFLAAFTKRNSLTKKEIREIRQFIDSMEDDDDVSDV
ncbi:MAG: BlaI/MecI/CopY family transcriptional regulator [Clostridiales bacterium]|nr:BlaI/MecI/CopY family transcriptional regulator [Clostridiales bacterium]MCD8110645.1 BlaI/MecI/CopY family transcriptional regulator [Clostridiales bacterium]MCD8134322.1 BlaI/MecI/CopY family transcriptional regulator [Clostridiales bacterium]